MHPFRQGLGNTLLTNTTILGRTTGIHSQHLFAAFDRHCCQNVKK
ncbi:hypothetical protein ACVW0Q_002510, partial [Thermostichus sp. MS-CIW-21]